MNTAARAVSLSGLQLRPVTRQGFWVFVLVCALLASAFTIVYSKDVSRRLFIREQQIKQNNAQAAERWSKLLLEQSTLASPMRIQRLAQARLNMRLPAHKKVRLLGHQRHVGK